MSDTTSIDDLPTDPSSGNQNNIIIQKTELNNGMRGMGGMRVDTGGVPFAEITGGLAARPLPSGWRRSRAASPAAGEAAWRGRRGSGGQLRLPLVSAARLGSMVVVAVPAQC